MKMKNSVAKFFMVSAALIICSSVCLGQEPCSSADVPKGWQKIKAYDSFTFCLPKSAWDTGLSGLDEYYKEYRIGRLRFSFTHQPMGITAYDRREKAFGKGFKEQVIEINGRKAYLYDYEVMIRGRKRYYREVYFGDHPKGDVELVMEVDSWRQADLELGRKILGTVEFTPKARS